MQQTEERHRHSRAGRSPEVVRFRVAGLPAGRLFGGRLQRAERRTGHGGGLGMDERGQLERGSRQNPAEGEGERDRDGEVPPVVQVAGEKDENPNDTNLRRTRTGRSGRLLGISKLWIVSLLC